MVKYSSPNLDAARVKDKVEARNLRVLDRAWYVVQADARKSFIIRRCEEIGEAEYDYALASQARLR